MSSLYTFTVGKVRDDKINIKIVSPYTGKEREFDIVVNKGGLSITGDEAIIVLPRATNSVQVDYMA